MIVITRSDRIDSETNNRYEKVTVEVTHHEISALKEMAAHFADSATVPHTSSHFAMQTAQYLVNKFSQLGVE